MRLGGFDCPTSRLGGFAAEGSKASWQHAEGAKRPATQGANSLEFEVGGREKSMDFPKEKIHGFFQKQKNTMYFFRKKINALDFRCKTLVFRRK